MLIPFFVEVVELMEAQVAIILHTIRPSGQQLLP
jgi:hypothetical protein